MKNNTKPTIFAVIAAVVIAAIVLTFLGIGGSLEFQFDDASFSIHTALWKDRTIAYADIESIEQRTDLDTGNRTNGYGSAKLSLGTFQNAEFGTYQLYSYTGCHTLVVLQLKDKTTLVLSGEDALASNRLYEAIRTRIE